MIFQNFIRRFTKRAACSAVARHNINRLEPQSGCIGISPFTALALPADAVKLLQSAALPDEATEIEIPSMPAFLDRMENCESNSRSIIEAGARLMKSHEYRHVSHGHEFNCTIGAPGISGVYLPEFLEPIGRLVALGATAAAISGDLGQTWLQLTMRRDRRPNEDAEWHQHKSRTHLICAAKVSGVFEVACARTPDDGADPFLMSPIAGMPVAINQQPHSRPFLPDGPAGCLSDVLLIWTAEKQRRPTLVMPPVLRKIYERQFNPPR